MSLSLFLFYWGCAPVPFSLSSADFAEQGVIPTALTCEGADRSPALRWQGVPKGAQSLALLIEDPDAPDPADPTMTWSHWVLYNLPVKSEGLTGSTRGAQSVPDGATVGLNDWKTSDYGGPCPPIGRHRYVHRLFALDARLSPSSALDRQGLLDQITVHQLAETQLIGLYEKGAVE